MDRDERFLELLRELEAPLAPDPAFRERLYERLRVEAGFDPAGRPGRRHAGSRLARRFALPPLAPVWRPLMLALLALVLAAAMAAGTYVTLQSWLSVGPGGIQWSDDFRLTEVYRDSGQRVEPGPLPLSLFYAGFAMAPDGSALYAVRMPEWPKPTASLVRFSGLDGSRLVREEVVAHGELSDAALWDPGLDPATFDVGHAPTEDAGALAVGPRGDVFLALGAYGRERMPEPWADEAAAELRADWPSIHEDEVTRITSRSPLLSVSVVALTPDGRRQRVVTSGELAEAGLEAVAASFSISLAASASDRLWLGVVVHGDGPETPHLFEITDPTADGDWSDRIVRPVRLPDHAPAAAGVASPVDAATGATWFLGALVAELTTPSVDRSRSVLLPMLSTLGEYRVYRLADLDGDGGATDDGEATLVLSGQPGFGDHPSPRVTSRVVVDRGREVLHELLVSGLTRPTRISRVSDGGRVIDIVRAVEVGPHDVEAAPNGDIYTVVQEPGTGDDAPAFVVHRLEPVSEDEAAGGSGASPSSSGARASRVAASPSTLGSNAPDSTPVMPAPAETVTPGVARIAYMLETFSETEESARIMVVGADGSGPTELIPGQHNSYFCQSADGDVIAFWSDEEVPHEPFVYLSARDGTGRRLLSDESGTFWCGFSSRYVLLAGRAQAGPILRHDLETGEEVEILSGSDWGHMHAGADGRRYVFVTGATPGTNPRRGPESLEVLDVESGERHVLHGPLPEDRMLGSLSWSQSGDLVAFAVGPRPSESDPDLVGRVEIHVTDAAARAARIVHVLDGRLPRLAFSSDDRHLLVAPPGPDAPGPLTLVPLDGGRARRVADEVTWADWHPTDAEGFAFATRDALSLTSVAGGDKILARVPQHGLCPGCETSGAPPGEWGWGEWMGWSPDARYIGLPDFSPVIAVVEVATGDLRVLTGDVGPGSLVSGARWLR